MLKSGPLLIVVLALLVCAAPPARSEAPGDHIYHTGFSSLKKLGRDLYTAVKQPYRETMSPQPIVMEQDAVPYVRLVFIQEEPKPFRGVQVSAGFIDLVNLVAHAKAIDKKEKGYFEKYIKLLASEKGDKELSPLPNDSNPAYWTEDMLNEQLSNFNSIVGMVVGIKLASHYLGYYDKYKTQLEDPKVRANNLLGPKEWDKCVALGARNALDAGCAIEGVLPFFEAFDKMGLRPEWSAYFLPDNVRFGKLKKDLERIQKNFFDGKE